MTFSIQQAKRFYYRLGIVPRRAKARTCYTTTRVCTAPRPNVGIINDTRRVYTRILYHTKVCALYAYTCLPTTSPGPPPPFAGCYWSRFLRFLRASIYSTRRKPTHTQKPRIINNRRTYVYPILDAPRGTARLPVQALGTADVPPWRRRGSAVVPVTNGSSARRKKNRVLKTLCTYRQFVI